MYCSMELGSTELAARLEGWAKENHGPDVRLIGEPEGNSDGFDSDIYFVRFEGESLDDRWRGPLVLRVRPEGVPVESACHEARIQNWLADSGFPAPRVLEVLDEDGPTGRPAQLMERAPGLLLIDAAKRRPWSARSLIGAMARLQVELTRMSTAGFPDGADLLDRRLALVRNTLDAVREPDLELALQRVEGRSGYLRECEPVICHGDFHPLNVLADGRRLSVIDWSDAGLGDADGDIARTLLLFRVAYLGASSPFEARVLKAVGPRLERAYRRAYETHRKPDPERVLTWQAVHAVHGWSQVVAARAGLFGVDPARLPDGLENDLAGIVDQSLR